ACSASGPLMMTRTAVPATTAPDTVSVSRAVVRSLGPSTRSRRRTKPRPAVPRRSGGEGSPAPGPDGRSSMTTVSDLGAGLVSRGTGGSLADGPGLVSGCGAGGAVARVSGGLGTRAGGASGAIVAGGSGEGTGAITGLGTSTVCAGFTGSVEGVTPPLSRTGG